MSHQLNKKPPWGYWRMTRVADPGRGQTSGGTVQNWVCFHLCWPRAWAQSPVYTTEWIKLWQKKKNLQFYRLEKWEELKAIMAAGNGRKETVTESTRILGVAIVRQLASNSAKASERSWGFGVWSLSSSRLLLLKQVKITHLGSHIKSRTSTKYYS